MENCFFFPLLTSTISLDQKKHQKQNLIIFFNLNSNHLTKTDYMFNLSYEDLSSEFKSPHKISIIQHNLPFFNLNSLSHVVFFLLAITKKSSFASNLLRHMIKESHKKMFVVENIVTKHDFTFFLPSRVTA